MKKLLALVLTLAVLTLTFCACGAKAVSSITIDEGLIREYTINQTPNFSGVKATIKYNDESIKSVTGAELTFSELDTSTAGTKQLTISYGGFSITVDIVVKASSAITKKPTKINVTEGILDSYELGSTPDFSGIKAIVTYNDGTAKNVNADELTVGTIDTSSAGEKMLAITYDGYTENVKISVVMPPHVTGITVTEGILTEYEFGATPDFSGIKATVYYSNGKTENVEFKDLTVGTLDTSVAGKKDIVITYNGYTKYVEVTVLDKVVITEIKVTEGLDETYDVNEPIDLSGIKAIVKYSNGTFIEVTAEDLKIGTIDTSAPGGQILEITYEDFTEHFAVTIIDYITGIEITAGVLAEYEYGSTPDFSGIKATVSYADGESKDVTYADLIVGTIDTTTVGKNHLKIEYDGFVKYVPVTVLPPVTVVGITITEGLKDEYKVGETPDLSGIKATITYSNGTEKNVTFAELTIGEIDTATAGEKMLTVTYEDFTKSFKVTVIVPPHITGITVTEGIADSYEFESTPDFSGIKATVTYSDGSEKNVTFAELTIGEIDTTVSGTQQLSITYDGYTAYVPVKVAEPAPEYEITSALPPSFITDRTGFLKSFKDQAKAYLVGDDNPFTFALIVNAWDPNDIPVYGIEYVGSSIVYLVTEGSEEIAGDEYVAIDELKHTFDFTEAAVGKTFRIVTRPSDVPENKISAFTNEHTVTVVDGYNVTNAKELNLITNSDGGMIHEGAANALTAVNTFLQNNGITRPATLASIVLHGDLKVTASDLPKEYFHTYTKDNITKSEFFDHLSIYYRRLTTAEPTFAIHGNYYTVYSYDLPVVVPNGQANNDDDYSSSELIKIETDPGLIVNGADLSPYYATIEDFGMRDSNPNTNDENVSERSMRGLIGIKATQTTLTITNTNIERFFVSTFADYDYTTLTLDKVNLYNAWQGHLFIWSDNNRNQGDDEEPWASHKPITVNIIDSSMTKCGGPVILSQNNHSDYKCNSKSLAKVNIDKASKLESWVTGEEAWFKAFGLTSTAMDIKGLSTLLNITGTHFGKNASYVKDENGTTYVNIIYVNMAAGADVLSILGGNAPDIDGTIAIDGKVVANQNDGENVIVDTYVGAIKQMTGSVPPVFQTSAGGTCFGNPYGDQPGVYGIDFSTGSMALPDASCFEGEYITLYYNGIAILLEYASNTL